MCSTKRENNNKQKCNIFKEFPCSATIIHCHNNSTSLLVEYICQVAECTFLETWGLAVHATKLRLLASSIGHKCPRFKPVFKLRVFQRSFSKGFTKFPPSLKQCLQISHLKGWSVGLNSFYFDPVLPSKWGMPHRGGKFNNASYLLKVHI